LRESGLWVYSARVVFARVEACSTSRAFQVLQMEIRDILRTAFCSLQYIHTLNQSSDVKKLPKPLELRSDEQAFVASLLNSFYADLKEKPKDTMDRRIRNALQLLIETDRQEHDAVALSLAMAAIEALVCIKGSDISNQIANNTAVLLEPDPSHREAAINLLKKIYSARSETLHGASLDHEHTLCRQAKQLASFVLLAFINRRDFQRKMGEVVESPVDLLNELRSTMLSGRAEIPGVSVKGIQQLWRGK
jgi:hypothetical protein